MLAELCFRSNPFFALICATQAFAVEVAFLGKDSCSSSSCHGGGGQNQNQNIVWSRQDPHSRASATLTTARSRRLAQLLKIEDPSHHSRCASCHAPWQNLPATALPGNSSAVNEAVSCETCHGPAGKYIRSHIRPELTREEKLSDGLRDLTILYNRANNCVACHQAVTVDLLEAGHPELLFELDGLSASMPRHWRERETNTHTIAWMTGQAAALRELTAQMMKTPSDRVFVQWQSALWVVNTALPKGPLAPFDTNSVSSPEKLIALHRAADQLALNRPYSDDPVSILKNLVKARFPEQANTLNAAQAERLVLAIDRVLYSVPGRRSGIQGEMDQLFKLVQSRPDFDGKQFAATLKMVEAVIHD